MFCPPEPPKAPALSLKCQGNCCEYADQHQQAQLVLFEPDVHVDAISPQVDVIHTGQIPGGEGPLLSLPRLGHLRNTAADRPADEPGNWPRAGTKSPLDSPCRWSSGSTSMISGVLRAQGGRIAEENRFRSPGRCACR